MGGIDLYWSPAGAHTARAYGPGYAVVALAVGAAPYLDIGDPPADTAEGALAATTPRLATGAELARISATPGIRTRPTTRLGYIPLAPAALGDVDAILFLPRLDPPAA
ncbi:MAG TPA: hypothetical protein VGL93_28865 [Streptosporangiaceae bacterium]|jgi:hypothetical protein